MRSVPDGPAPVLGLRERKKVKTRAAIREHALRLFREQGYAETTVDQIADAAEVSPSTFFRYFPTKEDVVLDDEFDPMLAAAFRSQPPELTPIQAVRASLPRSMKRPILTAVSIGSTAKKAVMIPSHTTERPSSTARYEVVMRISDVTICSHMAVSSRGRTNR